jgi:hypothetical protein
MCAKAIWRPACQQGFEQKSQEMFGYEHVAAVNSGTTALTLALMSGHDWERPERGRGRFPSVRST